jgi:hypothetical protein
LNKHRLFAAALCAVVAAVPAAPASAAGKKKAKPKPQYGFTYFQTRTSKLVSRCKIVTGGYTTVTTTTTETTWQSGDVGGHVVTINTRQLDQKQEVENSEYVRPYDQKGEPTKNTTSGPAKEIAQIKKDKLVFTYPGFDGLKAKTTVRLPGKVGGQVNKPVSSKLSSDPLDEGNGCSHSDETVIDGGLTVIRRK